MSPSYVIARDGEPIATVIADASGIEVTTPGSTRRHGSLIAALDAEPSLVTIDAAGAWTIECHQMPAWMIAERLVGEADEVLINDTIWLPFGHDVGWIPEDWDEGPEAETVSISFKSPGAGSPGGSPAWGLGATRIGDDLWNAWITEAIDLDDPWIREADGTQIGPRLVSQNVFGAVCRITDPFLADGDAEAVEQIAGSAHRNGWLTIWVNGVLWLAGDQGWAPAPRGGLMPVPPPLECPRLISVLGPAGFLRQERWHHFEVAGRVPTIDQAVTSLVVVPADAPNRDLLHLVHAQATWAQGEVGSTPPTTIIVDADGHEWLGVDLVDPDLALDLQQAVPDAVFLLWDEVGKQLVPGGASPTDLERLGLVEVDAPVSRLARRMEELDPLGPERFTDDALGMGLMS